MKIQNLIKPILIISLVFPEECCKAGRPLEFSYEHFTEWDSDLCEAEGFGTECLRVGHETIGCRFVAACVTSVAVGDGKKRLGVKGSWGDLCATL